MSSTEDSSVPAYVLWPYTPSLAGGVIAAAIMAGLFIAHGFRLVKNRTWFCIPFVIGALCEAVGYAGRGAAHYDTKTTTPYIIQSSLILLAPILFAASVYMILGRLIRRTESTGYSLVRATWVTKIFVGGDVMCGMVQSGGASLLISASDAAGFKLGENIILCGLVLQILIFAFFVVIAGSWHVRLARQPTAASSDIPWQKLMLILYLCSMCITLRNVYRVIEYAMGQDGYLLTHEWPLYFFDFLLMAIMLVVSLRWYDPNVSADRKRDVEFTNV